MEFETRNLFLEVPVHIKNADFDTSNSVFDPGVSTSSAGLQFEQEENSVSNLSLLDEVTTNSSFSIEQRGNINSFTKTDALKNCKKWVEKLQGQIKRNSRKKKIKSEVEQDEQVYSAQNESDVVSINSSCVSRKKRKYFKYKNEKLNLLCEWQDCGYFTSDLNDFVRHVTLHIPHLESKTNENGEGLCACLWESCGFETTDTKEIVRHVNFHSYHTKIKCIGSNMKINKKLPECTYDHDGRNLVPELPDVFSCCWYDCTREFNNSQMFFFHVESHVQSTPRACNEGGGIPCGWRGCRSLFRNIPKLVDHVRSHTQEKLVGCPSCGGLFSNRTKFFDHCKRQVPLELQGYQCSHCLKYYPSERLLREHMRKHVNHYKCSFCDMTCPSPSALSLHIRHRHLDFKPFKCNFCDFAGKTQNAIKLHLNTHCSEPSYHCDEDGCNFSCRSTHGIGKHFRMVHQNDDSPLYCCHICDKRFHRGYFLTRHLFIQHSFRWPSGHCRFRYKHDEDGFFRLQTVRYESLEVTQEMMQSELGGMQQVCGNSRYNLRRKNGGLPVEFTLSEEEDDPAQQTGEDAGRILISFEELDNCGNVICTKVVEAEEVPALPPGDVTLIQDGDEVANDSK